MIAVVHVETGFQCPDRQIRGFRGLLVVALSFHHRIIDLTGSILVTGGAGYIGSHTTDALVKAGHSVVVIDDLSTGHRAAVPVGARFELCDLNDQPALDRVMRAHRFDAIVHFAALSVVGESMAEPTRYLRENVNTLLNLIDCSARFGAPPLVLSSTANLFANPEGSLLSEDCPVLPGSPYGESKFFAERILHWMEQIRGLRSARLRYFNAAGADPSGLRGEDHRPETHLIPRMLQVAMGRLSHLDIYGNDYDTPDGTCIRDYVHVCDLASAHLLAVERLISGGPSLCYNLGSGTGFSVLEVVEAGRRVTGHAIPIRWADRRAGDPPRLVTSSQRIASDLGWRQKFADLDAIIATAWNWHRAHPNGFSDSRTASAPAVAAQ